MEEGLGEDSDASKVLLLNQINENSESPTALPLDLRIPETDVAETRSSSAYREDGMHRFASIDFLRGVAIVMMLFVHVTSYTLDVDSYVNQINDVGVINVLALILIPFLGGMAGLFLMVSAMGNMVGMRRNIEKGLSPSMIAMKQISGGGLIVAFAMFFEATLGSHGSVGQFARNLHRLNELGTTWEFDVWRYQGYHFETIHTIGWCIIVNGIVQWWVTSKWNLHTQGQTVIHIYWGLTIIILAITPFIWKAISAAIPGYPWDESPTTDREVYLPVIGQSPWYDFVLYFFVNPLAAPVEPIFPYLSTSFIGSILALHMTEPAENFDKRFVRRLFLVGIGMFIFGFCGVVILLSKLGDFDASLELYKEFFDHRKWTADYGVPSGWFWQWTTLNGASIMIVTVSIRLAEYRASVKMFAKYTIFFRRFGLLAFTVYIIQWVFFVIRFLVSLIHPAAEAANDRMPWSGTWITLALTLLIFHSLIILWSRCGCIGSIEWMLVSLANKMASVKKQISPESIQDKPWWQLSGLNINGALHGSKWLTFPPSAIINDDDLRLLTYLSWSGFIFFPFSLISFGMTHQILRQQPPMENELPMSAYANAMIRDFYRRSIAGIIFFVAWFITFNIITLNDLGLSL